MPAEKKTVLVIDDEPDTLTFLSTLLEDNGFTTVTAMDGQQAMNKVKESRPDLITLDITMPEKSGVRFYREMRAAEELKGVPIIIVTGVADDFERFISTRKKVPPPEGYLSKPVDQQKLIELATKLTS
jgi:CheY-like chemotaxis protein